MINTVIFRKELRENRIKFILCFLVLSVLAASIPLVFDLTRDILEGINLPSIINPQEIELILGSYDNFLWSQWTAKNLTQLASLAAIVLGMGGLAGEISFGTALFLLSKPVTRREVYTSKAAAGLFMLAVCTSGSTGLLLLISLLKGYTFNAGMQATAALITYGGAAVIYLGTAVFSTVAGEPVKAGVIAALFWLLVSVPGCFQASAPYSLFFQMKAIPFWFLEQSPFIPLGLFLVLCGGLYELGVAVLRRREF